MTLQTVERPVWRYCRTLSATIYCTYPPICRYRQKITNVLGLLEAAQKLGFDAKGVKGGLDSLSKIPKPAIAHVIVKKQLHHYVVIYKVTSSHITIMDPAVGKFQKKTLKAFAEEWTGVLVIMQPNTDFQKGNTKVSVYKRFWFLLKPHKFVLAQALVGAIVYTLLGFATSIYIQKITDFVLVSGNTNLLNLLGIIMLCLLVLQLLLEFLKIFSNQTGQQIDARLILSYKHLSSTTIL